MEEFKYDKSMWSEEHAKQIKGSFKYMIIPLFIGVIITPIIALLSIIYLIFLQ